MALPFTACGLVIGKGGVVQKEIAQKTGTQGASMLSLLWPGITVKITPKDQNVVPNERALMPRVEGVFEKKRKVLHPFMGRAGTLCKPRRRCSVSPWGMKPWGLFWSGEGLG